MTHYINIEKKRLCGRNNGVVPPLMVDYSTIETLEFQFINSKQQLQPLDAGLSGFYMAGSLKMGDPSCELLFLSKDFAIEDGKLKFSIDTYTQPYLRQIKKKNTEINIEIGQIALDTKKVWLRDYALANPRVYVAGLSPQEIESNDFYTKSEVNELVDEQAAATLNDAKNYADGQDAATLASANAYTDEAISHIELSGYATDEELEAAKAELEADIALKASEADLQIVSGAVDTKLDAPSGGTSGQVLTKTTDGAEWAALQIADYTVPDYFTVTAADANCEVRIDENIAGAAGLKAVLEYSTDGGLTWFNYAWSSGQGTLITLANVGDSVMFRGDNDSFSYNFLGQYYHLWASQNFKASGNLISLLDKKVKKKEAPASAFIYFFSYLGKLIDASELVLPKGNFSTYFGTFWHCPNLNEIHVNWTSWPANTNNWLDSVSASGTFYCPYGLPIIRDGFHIPVGWDVIYTDVPESVVSGAAAATEALTMING